MLGPVFSLVVHGGTIDTHNGYDAENGGLYQKTKIQGHLGGGGLRLLRVVPDRYAQAHRKVRGVLLEGTLVGGVVHLIFIANLCGGEILICVMPLRYFHHLGGGGGPLGLCPLGLEGTVSGHQGDDGVDDGNKTHKRDDLGEKAAALLLGGGLYILLLFSFAHVDSLQNDGWEAPCLFLYHT